MQVALALHAPGDLLHTIAAQARQRRRWLDLAQKALAERSGIPLGSIRHSSAPAASPSQASSTSPSPSAPKPAS